MNEYTPDLSEFFFVKLDEIATELGASALDMLSVMMSESGVKANAHNPNGDASGLIQFMPRTLQGVGWTQGHEKFRELTAAQQLPYVRRYFIPYKGELHTVGALYVATFLPAYIDHSSDRSFVLSAKNGPLGWAYAPNAAFDANHDYAITVGELEDAVARNCTGKRWAEIVQRATGQPTPEVPPALDLGTTTGIQTALNKLGYDCGKVDGIPGPKTRAAVVAFQAAHNLAPDGIVGPLTRAVLTAYVKVWG